METAEWRRITKLLRTNFPTKRPINIKRVSCQALEGAVHFDGRQFHIRIMSNQSDSSQIDSLLHEYGHCYAIDQIYEHCDYWGQIFAQIYKKWEDYNERGN